MNYELFKIVDERLNEFSVKSISEITKFLINTNKKGVELNFIDFIVANELIQILKKYQPENDNLKRIFNFKNENIIS